MAGWTSDRLVSGPLTTQMDLSSPAGGVSEGQLSRLVELEIIPRLMMMYSALQHGEGERAAGLAVTQHHVQTLALLSVDGSADSALGYVRALMEAGAELDDVLLELLAPAANLLGTRWLDDGLDFSQVTVGLWRLQQVLHDLGTDRPTCPCGGDRHILLSGMPGAQHSFGVAIVADFFARDGWSVTYEPQASWQSLQDAVADRWYDVIGLSLAQSQDLRVVPSAIEHLRRCSANRSAFVMVGGPLAAEMPELASLCGADAMALEAKSALSLANGRVRAQVKQG